jgi:hypothetical protein
MNFNCIIWLDSIWILQLFLFLYISFFPLSIYPKAFRFLDVTEITKNNIERVLIYTIPIYSIE